MRKILYMIIIIALTRGVFIYLNHVTLEPGIFAPNEPIQKKIEDPEVIPFKGYNITPLAEFKIKAKILSEKKYYFKQECKLSRIDLALGWGRMSDESVLKSIKISQTNRWYLWKTKQFPIPRKEIETHSSNMHIIHANRKILSKINRARIGDIVEFSGYLVTVKGSDGWIWKSSLTRNDTGNHACEIVFVKEFNVLKR